MNSPIKNAKRSVGNEVDLFDLIERLWRDRWLIISISAITLILGTAYAFLTPPIYKASVQIQKPASHTILPLNTLYSLDSLTPTSLTDHYLQILNSNEYKLLFLDSADEEVLASFAKKQSKLQRLRALNSAIQLHVPETKKITAASTSSISFEANTTALAHMALANYTQLAVDYLSDTLATSFINAQQEKLNHIHQQIHAIEITEAQKRQSLIKQLEERYDLEMIKLQDQLKASKYFYDARLKDHITRLEQALAIAQALEIKEPKSLTPLHGQVRGYLNTTDIDSESNPLYLRGSRFLNAEINEMKGRLGNSYPDIRVRELESRLIELAANREAEMLKARQNDADFSEEIASLKGQLIELENQAFPAKLDLKFINGDIMTDPTPVKPQRIMIVALSLMLGGILGIFTCLIRDAIRTRRQGRPD